MTYGVVVVRTELHDGRFINTSSLKYDYNNNTMISRHNGINVSLTVVIILFLVVVMLVLEQLVSSLLL